jgi:DNA-directed RNA polymerase subunit F
MTAKEDIRRELTAVAEQIATARAALARNELIDISGIPEKVQGVAGAIIDLAPEDAVDLRPMLMELLTDFKAFSEDVQSKIGEIQASAGTDPRTAMAGRSGT